MSAGMRPRVRRPWWTRAGVVVGEVAVELAAEGAVAWVEVAGECWSPAFVEDRLVQGFDVAVGLRPAGVDVGEACAEPVERAAEALAAELVAVVGEDALEPPAGLLQLRCDAAGELRGLGGGRVALLADHKLGPGVGAVAVDRGQLPDRAGGAA